jgi:peptidoglycan hydrolase CwlO-like protein
MGSDIQLNKKIQAIILTILIVVTASISVLATPNYDFSAIINANVITRTNIDNTINQVGELDGKLSSLIIKINKDKDTMTKLNADIVTTTKKIEATRKDMEEKKILFGKRVRVMYMDNYNANMVIALLEAKGFQNLIERIEIMKRIMKYDNKLMDDIVISEKTLKKEMERLEVDKKQIIEITAKNQLEEEQIITHKNELMAVLANLKVIRAKEIESGEVQYLTDKLQKDYTSYAFPDMRLPKATIDYKRNLDFYSATDLQTTIAVKQDDLIMYSASLIGVTYLWGGNDTKGLDCSGFTKLVYKHFGIVIPRVAEAQQLVGVDINDKKDLQPGDLLFFGKPAHHVAMFVTSGFMIEAPYTGEVIKISPIRPYVNAKRYINITPEQIKANTHLYTKTQEQPSVIDDNIVELPTDKK